MSIDIFPPVSAAPASSLPSGAMVDYAGVGAPPGWLLCDGSVVNRVTYATLFAAIGATWGAGDGSTTFGLPDLRGRVSVGVGTGAGLTARALAGVGGGQDSIVPSHGHAQTGTVSADHSHSGTTGDIDRGHVHGMGGSSQQVYVSGSGTSALRMGVGAVNTAGENTGHLHAFTTGGISANHTHTVNAVGVAVTDQNMPPWVGVNKIIKV